MNKCTLLFKYFFILLSISPLLYSNDFKHDCDKEQQICSDIFCNCKGLLNARIPNIRYTNSTQPPRSIPVLSIPFFGENNGSDGFGNTFNVCTKKQPCCLADITSPSRVTFCSCGWIKLTFSGFFFFSVPMDQPGAIIPSIRPTLKIRSNCFEDIIIYPVFTPIFSTSVALSFEEVLPPPCTTDLCHPCFFFLEIQNIEPNVTINLFFSKIIFERVGPCKHCCNEKDCCKCSSCPCIRQ